MDVFDSFGLSVLSADTLQQFDLPSHVASALRRLPVLGDQPIEAIQVYVDGSYFPEAPGVRARAGWAIAVLARVHSHWCYAGHLIAHAPTAGGVGTLGAAVGSSYEVELPRGSG